MLYARSTTRRTGHELIEPDEKAVAGDDHHGQHWRHDDGEEQEATQFLMPGEYHFCFLHRTHPFIAKVTSDTEEGRTILPAGAEAVNRCCCRDVKGDSHIGRQRFEPVAHTESASSYFFAVGSTATATASVYTAWTWSPTLIIFSCSGSSTFRSTECSGPRSVIVFAL